MLTTGIAAPRLAFARGTLLYRLSDVFCRPLIIFANSLDQDQARQNGGSDPDLNRLTLWSYSWKKSYGSYL